MELFYWSFREYCARIIYIPLPELRREGEGLCGRWRWLSARSLPWPSWLQSLIPGIPLLFHRFVVLLPEAQERGIQVELQEHVSSTSKSVLSSVSSAKRRLRATSMASSVRTLVNIFLVGAHWVHVYVTAGSHHRHRFNSYSKRYLMLKHKLHTTAWFKPHHVSSMPCSSDWILNFYLKPTTP